MQTNAQLSKLTEELESKYASKGLQESAITYDPVTDKVYLGDGRNGLESEGVLINMKNFRDAKKFVSEGKHDSANRLKPYSNLYLQMLANKNRIVKSKLANPFKSINAIGDRILGASGPTATTDYDAVRHTGEIVGVVTGEEHTPDEYNAINIAERLDKDAVKFEYLRRTSSKIVAQRNLGDEDIADPIKNAYTTGTKELFAYGLSFLNKKRDNIDMKLDIKADFVKQVDGAFLQAKNEDVLTILNAITGNNQGNWKALTGGVFDVDASVDIQTAEKAVKPYGNTGVKVIMADDTRRGYVKNLQGASFTGRLQNEANRGTANQRKSGQLEGNESVQYFIDDGLTAGTYVLANPNYMKYFQGMVIQTTYKELRSAGQTEQMFWYDYAGFEETEVNAQYKGTSVLA
jgi:hypothetical protein